MANQHVNVLIVGAGLSGIGAGYHLQSQCPGKSYAILEAREAIGGTWDLFRYATSTSRCLRSSGSPPVRRSLLTPWPTKRRAVRVISSNDNSEVWGRNL